MIFIIYELRVAYLSYRLTGKVGKFGESSVIHQIEPSKFYLYCIVLPLWLHLSIQPTSFTNQF